MDSIKELKNIDKEDILAALGLQPKSEAVDYILPVLGIFSAGMLLGTGLGMLIAPRTGRALRKEIGKKVTHVTDKAMNAIDEVRSH